MLITEKQLRATIRKLILENTRHFDKLIVLLSSPNVENIRQGIQLAEDLEYLTVKRYEIQDKSEWDEDYRNYWYKKDPRELEPSHDWTLEPIPEFLERFRELHPQGVEHRKPGGHALQLVGSVKIRHKYFRIKNQEGFLL